MWDWNDTMMNGWWWLLLVVPLMVIFWSSLIALIVWGIKKIGKGEETGTGISSKRDSLDIVKERYAKGEISREEFEQMKKDLS